VVRQGFEFGTLGSEPSFVDGRIEDMVPETPPFCENMLNWDSDQIVSAFTTW